MSVKNLEEPASVTREQLVALLRRQLTFHAALGIAEYPVSSSLRRFFALTDGKEGVFRPERMPARKEENGIHTERRGPEVREKFVFLRQEIAECRHCHLSPEKSGSVFGGGNHACSLMVVGDWSRQRTDDFSREIFFGPDEDVMLWKMMAAIDFNPGDIYVTNCIKCCPGEKKPPDRTSEQCCFSFLEREVALTGPRIICAMGEVAARLLTGSVEPLARLRGKFVRYRYQSANEILVVPTYHPRFLLRHQEMKKATWLDLQAIKKKLSANT